MILNFVQAPELDAGVDQIICEDDRASLNATVNYQNSLLWTTSGTGTFENGVNTISNPIIFLVLQIYKMVLLHLR